MFTFYCCNNHKWLGSDVGDGFCPECGKYYIKAETGCHMNCMDCVHYPTAKDKKQCPSHKLRAKYIRHDIYERKRKARLGGKYVYKP